MRSKIEHAAVVEAHVTANRGEFDIPRISILSDVKELFGKAADIKLRTIKHSQVARGRRHVYAAAQRNCPPTEHDAGTGKVQARTQAVLQVL
ncbi:hypothetical protein D3C81_2098480 [compost metagenome]